MNILKQPVNHFCFGSYKPACPPYTPLIQTKMTGEAPCILGPKDYPALVAGHHHMSLTIHALGDRNGSIAYINVNDRNYITMNIIINCTFWPLFCDSFLALNLFKVHGHRQI